MLKALPIWQYRSRRHPSPIINIDNRIGGALHIFGSAEKKIVTGDPKPEGTVLDVVDRDLVSKPFVGASQPGIC